MREKIDLFLPCEYIDDAQNALSVLHEYKTVQHIHFLVSADFAAHHQVPEGCTFVITDRLESSNTIVSIAENTDADYVIDLYPPHHHRMGKQHAGAIPQSGR